jgi:regulator of protease activity HflC (stomatin/prohibitin superfamily)
LRSSKNPSGLHGPGTISYYPGVDSGISPGCAPEKIKIGEKKQQLAQIQCYTKDWKDISVDANISYRVQNPVHFLVNIKDPINAMKILCETYLRDIILTANFDNLRGRENKEILRKLLKVTLQI